MVKASPALFKIEKIALILEKKALIVSIFGLIFHSKCSFKSVWEKKLQNALLQIPYSWISVL